MVDEVRTGGLQRLLDGEDLSPAMTEVDADTARARVRRGLVFLPFFLVIALMAGFFLGDWVIATPMLLLAGWAGVRLIRELKEPDRFLRLAPREVAERILERPHLLHRVGGNEEGAGHIMELQELHDRLEPGGGFERRTRRILAQWGGWLGAAGMGVFGLGSALSGGDPGMVITGFAAGGLFLGAGLAERRREAKRKKALSLVEEALDGALLQSPARNGHEEE